MKHLISTSFFWNKFTSHLSRQ